MTLGHLCICFCKFLLCEWLCDGAAYCRNRIAIGVYKVCVSVSLVGEVII